MPAKKSALMSIAVADHHSSLDRDLVTLMELRRRKSDAVESVIADNNGKIVHRTDDSFFVSFVKPLSALNCAFAIESKDNEEQSGEEQIHRINLQIGLHFGQAEKDGNDFQRTHTIAEQAGHGEVSVSDSFFHRFSSKYGVNSLRKSNIAFGADDETLIYHTVNPVLLPRKKLVNKKSISIGAIAGGLGLIFAFFGMIFEGSQTDFVRELFTSKTDTIQIATSSVLSLPEVKVDSNRVAVLPLRNLTGDERMTFYSQGLAEDVIFRLNQINDLYVYPLSDVLGINAEQKTSSEVRAALGAKYLVQGSYQLDGDSLMVTIEVIDAEKIKRLSSEKFVGVKSEIRELNQRVSRAILFPIVGQVSGEAEAALAAFASTSSLAGDLYLKALYAERNVITWEDQQKVIRLYESAVEADSNFALARSHLSKAYGDVYGKWQNDKQWNQKAMEQAKHAVSLSSDLPEAHFVLGRALEKNLDYSAAERSYRQAISMRPDYRAPRDAMGDLYAILGKYDGALSLYHQSLELNKSFGDLKGVAETMNYIGFVHFNRGENEQAFEFNQSALAISREIGDKRREAKALDDLGWYFQKTNNLDSAMQYSTSALSISREIGDRYEEARNLNSIGMIHKEKRELDTAIDYYRESLKISRDIGGVAGEAWHLNNIGGVYNMKGDRDKALELYHKSLNTFSQNGYIRGEAAAQYNIGLIHFNKKQNEFALRNFQSCLKIYRKLGDSISEAKTLRMIGKTQYRMGEVEQSLKSHTASLTIYREIGNKSEASNAYINLAVIKSNIGEFYLAKDYFMASLDLSREIEDKENTARALYNIGTVHIKLGDFRSANEVLTQSLNILKEIDFKRGEAFVYGGLGDLFMAENRLQEAESLYNNSTLLFAGLSKESEYLWSVLNVSRLNYEMGNTTDALNSLIKIVENPKSDLQDKMLASVYLGACKAKLGDVETGLAKMTTAVDSLSSLKYHAQTIEAHCIIAGVLLDLGSKDEARRHLEEGQGMAEKSGMKGELRMYEDLMDRLKVK